MDFTGTLLNEYNFLPAYWWLWLIVVALVVWLIDGRRVTPRPLLAAYILFILMETIIGRKTGVGRVEFSLKSSLCSLSPTASRCPLTPSAFSGSFSFSTKTTFFPSNGFFCFGSFPYTLLFFFTRAKITINIKATARMARIVIITFKNIYQFPLSIFLTIFWCVLFFQLYWLSIWILCEGKSSTEPIGPYFLTLHDTHHFFQALNHKCNVAKSEGFWTTHSCWMIRVNEGMYEKYIKRGLDIILSFGGLVVLSPVFLAIFIAIKIDDPGPVLFTQKRVGKNKEFFKLHKFRSMKMCTPHDKPTHMLENPEQYITKVPLNITECNLQPIQRLS